MPSIEIRDGVNFPCPWCGLTCTASIERACVLHPMPMCPEFEKADPIEILKTVNKKTEAGVS